MLVIRAGDGQGIRDRRPVEGVLLPVTSIIAAASGFEATNSMPRLGFRVKVPVLALKLTAIEAGCCSSPDVAGVATQRRASEPICSKPPWISSRPVTDVRFRPVGLVAAGGVVDAGQQPAVPLPIFTRVPGPELVIVPEMVLITVLALRTVISVVVEFRSSPARRASAPLAGKRRWTPGANSVPRTPRVMFPLIVTGLNRRPGQSLSGADRGVVFENQRARADRAEIPESPITDVPSSVVVVVVEALAMIRPPCWTSMPPVKVLVAATWSIRASPARF